jgi:predicted HicB family RNase H-like nuclease
MAKRSWATGRKGYQKFIRIDDELHSIVVQIANDEKKPICRWVTAAIKHYLNTRKINEIL